MNENSVEVCVVKKMVGAEGFEPPTPASQTLCSTRLSHAPTFAVCGFLEVYWKFGRGGGIRTPDPSVPNAVLYQTEPRPVDQCCFRYAAYNT
jgi:hypothetical protein